MKTTVQRAAALLLIAISCSRCAESPTTPSALTSGSTSLTFTSSPGDIIGQGEWKHYGVTDGNWWAGADASRGTPNQVTIRISNFNEGWWWSLDLAAPVGKTLTVGTYEAAARSPFQSAGQPGLNFSGSGRGCDTLTGRFKISEIAFGPGNTIDTLRATFEQRCGGSSASLSGDVTVLANPWR